MDKTKAPNGILWACLGFSLFMIAHFFAFRFNFIGIKLYSASVMAILFILTLIFVIFMKGVLKDGRSFKDFLNIKSCGFLNAFFAFLAVLLFVPGTSALVIINDFIVKLITRVDTPVPDINIYMELRLPVSLLLMAVLPSICEELFFRGFILGATSGYSKATVIIFNGALFSLAHLSLYRILDTFVIGMIFAYVALKTKSIFPSMIMHFVNNASRVLLAFLLYSSDFMKTYQEQYEASAELGINDIIVYILLITFGILIFMAGLFLVSKMKSIRDHKRWLYGLPPEEEMSKRDDKVPKLIQIFFIVPGMACYIIMGVFLTYGVPEFIKNFLRVIWGL